MITAGTLIQEMLQNGDILSIFFSYELGYINKKLSHFQSDYLLLQLVLESPLFASSEIDKLVH